MLKDELEKQSCFKLICGAGNEDVLSVEKLVALYAKAGCRFFDISAKEEILDAAKRGLARVIPLDERSNFYFCISVGVKDDPHFKKAAINPYACDMCRRCEEICPQGAIFLEKEVCEVNQDKCIGCSKCAEICSAGAVRFSSQEKDLKKILPPLIKKGVDCIEFHILSENDDEVDQKWDEINSLFDGMLSISINRSKFGDEKLITRLEKMLQDREPYTTIIQADGNPMNGGSADFKSTLQAVSMAEVIQNTDLPVFIILSGGTNPKTAQLAKQCGVTGHGVAMGSYARKIVKKYLDRADFFDNEKIFNEALELASELVSSINPVPD